MNHQPLSNSVWNPPFNRYRLIQRTKNKHHSIHTPFNGPASQHYPRCRSSVEQPTVSKHAEQTILNVIILDHTMSPLSIPVIQFQKHQSFSIFSRVFPAFKSWLELLCRLKFLPSLTFLPSASFEEEQSSTQIAIPNRVHRCRSEQDEGHVRIELNRWLLETTCSKQVHLSNCHRRLLIFKDAFSLLEPRVTGEEEKATSRREKRTVLFSGKR